MKIILTYIFIILSSFPQDFTQEIDQFNITFEHEYENILSESLKFIQPLNKAVQVEKNIILDDNYDPNYRLQCLLSQLEIKNEITNLEKQYDVKFAALRYEKGIDILKMLYEKVLALDHHFTSLNTLQSINDLSNPNSFPEFSKVQEMVKDRTEKKNTVKLPNFLSVNPYVSLTTSVISSFFGKGDKKERSQEISSISCMLDFTVNMYSDLKVIYFETEYLKSSNKELLDACNQLFIDYTKAIGYKRSLVICRDTDDWDAVSSKLEKKVSGLLNKNASNSYQDRKSYIKELNNIEFSIDRLLSFMDDYSDFVNDGEKYYQKFLSIVQSYKHKEICVEQLPATYAELEKEIELSIEKFNTAYKIAELQGTKLRDLLYGIPE